MLPAEASRVVHFLLVRRYGLGPLTTADVFSFMFFWLEPKEPKVQGKHRRSAGFAGPAHRKTLIIYMSFFIPSGRTKTRLRNMRSNGRR